MAAPARVTANGWGWRYGGRRLPAVSEVSFTIEPGERVLLLGASGAGKSTLLAGLAGVLGDADEGERTGSLLVDGSPPESRRGAIGLVLQDPDAGVVLSMVGDDVAFGCENLGVPASEIPLRVTAALDEVGLNLSLDRPTRELSGGQKQRLALAGLLAMRPGLLLLDEPTANLDPEGVLEVRDAVRAALEATGATLVVVEHRVAVWRDLVTRVVVLGADGGVLADGAPDAVLADADGELGRAGVWLPGTPVPEAPVVREGMPLLTARSLAFGRAATTRSRRRRRARADAAAATVPVGHPVDLEVRAGSAFALTGRNGSGKSTLALTLGGLLPGLGGELIAEPLLADGASSDPASWRSRELLTRIGSVFQNPEHQFIAGTVRDELAAGPRALHLPTTEVDERVDELLDRLALTDAAAANPFTLSGGQKRRLSVATALATRPRLLVLDEPTFGQDARTWQELVRMIASLRHEGHAIVAATHDAEFVRAVGAASLRLDVAEVTA
jgi:energy-coupling factor transport system ATP-binding protein